MIILRRRLLYWLLREYLKKWGKTILFSFVIGLGIFILLLSNLKTFASRVPLIQREYVGIVGTYSVDKLPPVVLSNVSRGLTVIDSNGTVKPDVAKSWKIENSGKKYTFFLRNNVFFSDGKRLTSDQLVYNFSRVKVKRPDKYIIVFELDDNYAAFLVTASRPILKEGLVGVGNYKIKDVKLSGNFIQSITLVSVYGKLKTITYKFYPNSETLKTAFVLGEVDKAVGLPDKKVLNTSFDKFSNVEVKKRVNFERLVTLFYNTKDDQISNRDIRLGLSYALLNEFSAGERSYTMYSSRSWAYTDRFNYSQDLENAKKLVVPLRQASESARRKITIKTLPKYKDVADEITKVWKNIDVLSDVKSVDAIPSEFQVFVGDFRVPSDPDQYLIWHSGQETNITGFENKRIDKLLEDGRRIIDQNERKKIYTDFQKYILADSPAAFLYFPYEYDITRL